MFWTIEKLQARIRELDGFRYRDMIKLHAWRMKPDEQAEIGAYPSDEGTWSDISIGHRWRGRDVYYWLAADAAVPAEWSGKTIVGMFDFGQTGGSNNSGFESLLFVNGHPYQGVDTNHREVLLPEDAAGRKLELRFRLWSGLGGYASGAVQEHRLGQGALAWLDEGVDDLYYSGRAALEAAAAMPDSMPERHELLGALDRAFLRIDWSRPGSPAFYESVREARNHLQGELERMPKRHAVTVRCIGHTHIDVAWLWRLRHTREKAARSFSTVLRLMDRFPDYVFLQTQPQLYEYIKEDYPELYERIRARVDGGRWEAGGAMWLEADCNLTSGESLVRQLLYGIRFFQNEFGVKCDYLWLPDVFGYSWALPQILLKSGIKAFMTTKISWNQYNRMPHDTFWWRGIDGSEILTHFITTPDPGGTGQGGGTFYYTYNGAVTARTVQGIWDAYQDKALNRELLLSYGYGDGGGGVNREMLEMRRRLAELPGVPHVTTGRADTFFRDLEKRVREADEYVHTWDGELYLELHRGTYTSQAYNKRMNRRLELLYREAEWLGVTAALLGQQWTIYPQDTLYEGWKIILRNQFHDIIPGSSIREVYEDSRVEYAEAERIGGTVRNEAAHRLTAEGQDAMAGVWTVFNGSSWPQTGLVAISAKPEMDSGTWQDSSGRVLPAERTGDSWLVHVDQVPSMGWSTIKWSAAVSGSKEETVVPFTYAEGRLETPHYVLEWNDEGRLTKLWDKSAGRSVLAPGAEGNVLQIFEDKPKSRHEAWDIDLFYQEKMRTVDDLQSVKAVEIGALRAVLEFEWRYMDSVIRQRLITYADSRRIDFATSVEWHEHRQLLKAAFPVDIRSTEATYDIQFGNVRRPTHWNTSWDYARFETVGHQWADLSEAGYGVSLLNDCKYGYDIKDNVMRLSLIKSARVPDAEADQGEHTFTYALLPHTGDWREGQTVSEAWALNNSLLVVKGAGAQSAFSLFRISAPECVMIDTVKKAEDEDAVIVRLHEYCGSRGEIVMESGLPIEEWVETNLLEEPEREAAATGSIRFSLKPYEIKTFRVKFNLLTQNVEVAQPERPR